MTIQIEPDLVTEQEFIRFEIQSGSGWSVINLQPVTDYYQAAATLVQLTNSNPGQKFRAMIVTNRTSTALRELNLIQGTNVN